MWNFLNQLSSNSWKLAIPGWGLLAAVALWEALFVLCLKYMATAFGKLPNDLTGVAPMLLLLVALALSRACTQMAHVWWETRRWGKHFMELQQRFLSAVGATYHPVHRPEESKKLRHALEEDGESILTGIKAAFNCTGALIQIAIFTLVLLVLAWKAALVLLLLGLATHLVSRFKVSALSSQRGLWRQEQEHWRRQVECRISRLEMDKGNGFLLEKLNTLRRGLEPMRRTMVRWELLSGIFPPLLETLYFLFLIGALLWLGHSGFSDQGGHLLLPVLALLLFFYRPIREFSRNYPLYLAGRVGWQHREELLRELESKSPMTLPQHGRASVIDIHNLSFTYGADPVFHGYNLKLKAYETTLIMGGNGAGKSTLLRLLARVEIPAAGSILYPSEWAGAQVPTMAYLPQDSPPPQDFPLLWTEAASRQERWLDEVDRVLGIRRIWQLYGLGSAAKASLGDWTASLSAGERRRISLAACVISPACYLLLDEPSSWLSPDLRGPRLPKLLDRWRQLEGSPKGCLVSSHEPGWEGLFDRVHNLEERKSPSHKYFLPQ